MSVPNYSFVLSAQVSGGTGIATGNLVITNSSSPAYFVPATTANRGSRRCSAIALTDYSGSDVGSVQLQQAGTIDATLSGLGVGAQSWVRCSTAGIIERCTPSGSDDIVGYAEADGSVHLLFGLLTAAMINGGGGGSTTPGGSDTQLQFNDGGAFGGAASWLYNKATGALTMAAAASLLLANAAGTGSWKGIVREGSGTTESVGYNINAAGDPNASAPVGYFGAKTYAYLGMNDAAASVNVYSAAFAGVATTRITPNLGVGNATLDANQFGGGTGVLHIRTQTEATSLQPTNGVDIWHDTVSTTNQLLASTKQSAGLDIYPITPVYNSYTFGSDANANLTTAQSRYTHLVVTTGVLTATRKLTNTSMPPTRFHAVVVQNNNAQSVQYAWSSGTAVTIASGATAIVTGDGTNAVSIPIASSGGGVTWANDLSTSSSSNQYVSGISGSNGTGGTVPIVGGVNLQFGSAGGGTINVASVGTTGASLTIAAGASSGTAGGSLNLNSGAGVSAGVAGNINMSLGPTLAMQITAGSLAAGDIMSTGSGTVMQRFAKGSNSTVLNLNSSGVLNWSAITPVMIQTGTSGQFLTTAAGPVVQWGNTAGFYADNGATPATTGVLRASNGTNIVVVRGGSSNDVVAMSNTGSDVYFASDNTGAANQATNVRFYPSSAFILGITNSNYFVGQSSSVISKVAHFFTGTVGGESATSTPFHWASASVALSGTTQTLTAAQYACPLITLTGGLTSPATVIAPGTPGAEWVVFNNGTGSINFKAASGTGPTIPSGTAFKVVCLTSTTLVGVQYNITT